MINTGTKKKEIYLRIIKKNNESKPHHSIAPSYHSTLKTSSALDLEIKLKNS